MRAINTLNLILERSAFLHPEPQCPASTTWINHDGTDVAEVVDFDTSTCLMLSDDDRDWVQMSLPVKRMKPQFYVWLIGNLNCSPLDGLIVSLIRNCDSIASTYVTSVGVEGCKYRCHSAGICNSIIVDIQGCCSVAQPRSIY